MKTTGRKRWTVAHRLAWVVGYIVILILFRLGRSYIYYHSLLARLEEPGAVQVASISCQVGDDRHRRDDLTPEQEEALLATLRQMDYRGYRRIFQGQVDVPYTVYLTNQYGGEVAYLYLGHDGGYFQPNIMEVYVGDTEAAVTWLDNFFEVDSRNLPPVEPAEKTPYSEMSQWERELFWRYTVNPWLIIFAIPVVSFLLGIVGSRESCKRVLSLPPRELGTVRVSPRGGEPVELSDSEKRALWSELSRAKYKGYALGESGEPWDDAGYRVRVEDTAGKLVGELILWEGEWEGKVRLDTTPFHIWLKEADGLRARLDGILSNRMWI